ncbi:ATP-binding cassette domain-containing protein [Hymenobacter lutimineralis]|uniref:Probable ATP-binding protein YbiT n=1 Tax=Hymenobacter lutimineralis TaxID=2606448 RepID=A0A5D6UV68_9BACT|nr:MULTISPECIES: ATP-binding cassette domain-containing protein [Hymenobacter]QIX59666.1 ATP-binding cassette domain-containing protein [Hymenobacter sp. BT18]TYZ06344.1 ATP-binding cassette domain-containing protein [Hymenobacter lutimineralis]
MISTTNVSLRYGKRILFEDVTIKFMPGNVYGLIGANGAGKSTFLKILSGEIEPNTGSVDMPKGARLSVLKQNQFAYDAHPVLQTVIMGHTRLWKVMEEKDAIYAKADFSDADGERAAELEGEFADLEGWNAEYEAAELLSGLGIGEDKHHTLMGDLGTSDKVRVLLAQALFGNPDVLLLDEPTNGLDAETVLWLENFLDSFQNTVIVVSHDRHFLDAVCNYMADLDFSKITMYPGNYSFWYESSQLALRQRQEVNKKTEDKRKELEEFVRRFSANASKSKQATSRQKLLQKLTLEEIKPSSRKYPYIAFKPEREAGNQLLTVENLSKSVDGQVIFKNVSFALDKKDKVAIISRDDRAASLLFDILFEQIKADSGSFKWGTTITPSYFPKENEEFFDTDLNLVDWLRQYSTEKDESFIRGFLGRMLFSGEESQKKSNVLSGGEKVRCMLSKMMMEAGNVLVLNDPTNHLDLESITALNNSLQEFNGTLLFASHDLQVVETVANRIIELTPTGIIDRRMDYEEYLADENIKTQRQRMYQLVS